MAATDIGRVVGGSWPAQPTIGQDGIRTLGIMSTWPQGRSLHGGVDEIPLPPAAGGRLWLSGKHFIGPDPEAALRRIGATAIVCLTEPAELIDRYPAYVDWLRANQPARALWWPVPDLHVPDLDDAIDLLGPDAARPLRRRHRQGRHDRGGPVDHIWLLAGGRGGSRRRPPSDGRPRSRGPDRSATRALQPRLRPLVRARRGSQPPPAHRSGQHRR